MFFFLLFSTLPLPFSIASDMSWWIFCFWRKKFVFCSTTSQFSYSVVNTFPLLTVELMLLCSRFYFIYLVSVCVVIRVSNFWRCQSAVWIISNWITFLKILKQMILFDFSRYIDLLFTIYSIWCTPIFCNIVVYNFGF